MGRSSLLAASQARGRARAAVIVLGAVLMSQVASPVWADDLDDYLDRAAQADYAGRRVVVTVWDGRSEAAVADIDHADGMVMISDAGREVMIGDGKMMGAGSSGVTFSAWSNGGSSARYVTGDELDVIRLGRPAHSVTVLEGDLVRAKIIFDAATWAPLATEIYDGEGRLFRLSTLTDFDPVPEKAYAALRDSATDTYDVMPRIEQSSLPVAVAGYERLDTYMAPDGVIHAFYGDGLFSFSIFVLPSDSAQPDLDGATSLDVDGDRYLVLVEPAETWVSWTHKEVGYVLVGDLPPDHLVRVLAALPNPQGRNLIERILGFFS
jgi:hypothetical protein